MTETNELFLKIKDVLEDKIIESKNPMPRRIYIKVDTKDYKSTIKQLVKMGITFVSTMTGLDTGKEIELLTHLFGEGSEITIITAMTREKPSIESITDLIPGAAFYEREIYDLLGVRFKGHPNLERLLLPEKWPRNVHPLRKDFRPEQVKR